MPARKLRPRRKTFAEIGERSTGISTRAGGKAAAERASSTGHGALRITSSAVEPSSVWWRAPPSTGPITRRSALIPWASATISRAGEPTIRRSRSGWKSGRSVSPVRRACSASVDRRTSSRRSSSRASPVRISGSRVAEEPTWTSHTAAPVARATATPVRATPSLRPDSDVPMTIVCKLADMVSPAPTPGALD